MSAQLSTDNYTTFHHENIGYVSEAKLRLTEKELDRKLLNSPAAIAQRVEVELIKNLKRNAPWLIPMTIAK